MRRERTNDFVDLFMELFARFRRGHWNRDHDALRVLLPHRDRGSAHGRARREPVVHENYDVILDGEWRPVTTIEPLASLQFLLLTCDNGLDCCLWDLQARHLGIHGPD